MSGLPAVRPHGAVVVVLEDAEPSPPETARAAFLSAAVTLTLGILGSRWASVKRGI